MMLSDVCLSVAYIGPKSRTKSPRKTKIGTEVAHVTCDLDTTFKVKRSKFKVTGGGDILCRRPAELVNFGLKQFHEKSIFDRNLMIGFRICTECKPLNRTV